MKIAIAIVFLVLFTCGVVAVIVAIGLVVDPDPSWARVDRTDPRSDYQRVHGWK